MKPKLTLLALSFIAMFALAGCKTPGSGSDSAGSSYGGNSSAVVSSYSSTSTTGGAGDVSGDTPGDVPINPEPATVALLGGGLMAFAFLKRKKRKK